MYIHENFGNYGVFETVAVKFVYCCYYFFNWNLGDFFNQGYMFVSMGYGWVFGNCLKYGFVYGGIF